MLLRFDLEKKDYLTEELKCEELLNWIHILHMQVQCHKSITAFSKYSQIFHLPAFDVGHLLKGTLLLQSLALVVQSVPW